MVRGAFPYFKVIFLSFHFQLKSVMEGSPFKCLESIFLWIKNWIKSLFFLAKFNHRMNCRIVPPRANTSWSCPRNGEIYVGAGQFGNFLHSIHVYMEPLPWSCNRVQKFAVCQLLDSEVTYRYRRIQVLLWVNGDLHSTASSLLSSCTKNQKLIL